MTKKKWTKEEEKLVSQFFEEKQTYSFMTEKLNRSRLSIYHRAKKLGIITNHMISCKEQSHLRKKGFRKCYMCNQIFPLSKDLISSKRCKECNKIKAINYYRNMSEDKIFYRRWYEAKRRAEKSKLEFSISIEDIKNQYLKQNGLCYYTGNKLQVKILPKTKSFNSASIDRVNSNEGYTKSNIVICSNFVNRMKDNLDVNLFIQLCSQISNYSMMRNTDVR